MVCKLKINLKNISKAVRKKLNIRKGYLEVTNEEDLINSLAVILANSKLEKQILLANLTEETPKVFDASSVDTTDPAKLNALIENARKQLSSGSSVVGIIGQDFGSFIKKSSERIPDIIDKLNRGHWKGAVQTQMRTYLNTLLYELNLINNSDIKLDPILRNNLKNTVTNLRAFQGKSDHLDVFPHYVATIGESDEVDNVYFITSDFSDLDLQGKEGQQIVNEFERLVNNTIIEGAVNTIEDKKSDASITPSVGIAVKLKTIEGEKDQYLLFRAKRDEDGNIYYEPKQVNGNTVVERRDLFIPDVDYISDVNRDHSTQWVGALDIDTFISPRFRKDEDLVKGVNTENLQIKKTNEIASLPNKMIRAAIDRALLGIENWTKNNIGNVNITTHTLFMKGRREVLNAGGYTYVYDNGWKVIHDKPEYVITKGLAERSDYGLFDDNRYVGEVDTLNYHKVTTSTIDGVRVLNSQPVDVLAMTDVDMEKFVMDNFSISLDYLKKLEPNYTGYSEIENIPISGEKTTLGTHVISNIRLNQLQKAAPSTFNPVINKIVKSYQRKLNILKQLEKIEVGSKFKLQDVHLSANVEVSGRFTKEYTDLINLDNAKFTDKFSVSFGDVKAKVFMTYFGKGGEKYWVLTNVELGGVNQKNYIIKDTELKDILNSDESIQDPYINFLKQINNLSKEYKQPLNREVNKQPKIVIIEQSDSKPVYYEVSLAHKKFEATDEFLNFKNEATRNQFSNVWTRYSDILNTIHSLIKAAHKKSEGGVGFNMAKLNGFTQNLPTSVQKTIKAILESKYANYIENIDSNIKVKPNVSGKITASILIDIATVLYNSGVNVTNPLESSTLVTSIMRDFNFMNILPTLNTDIVFSALTFGTGDSRIYVPLNIVANEGINRESEAAIYGFSKGLDPNSEESTNYWDLVTAYYRQIDEGFTIEGDYKNDISLEAFSEGWVNFIEFNLALHTEGSFPISASVPNRDELINLLNIAKTSLVDKKEKSKSDSNETIELIGLTSASRKSLKEFYLKYLHGRKNITGKVTLSYQTKLKDWETIKIGSQDSTMAKGLLETNIDPNYPLFKSIKYAYEPPIVEEQAVEEVSKETAYVEPKQVDYNEEEEDFKLEGEGFTNDVSISEEEINRFLVKVLPFVSYKQYQEIKHLISSSRLKGVPIGVAMQNIIALKEQMKGNFYHEAFHIVFNQLFTKEEQRFYLNELKNRLNFTKDEVWAIATPRGITDYNEALNTFLEEKLADEFALFKLNQPTTLIGKLGEWLKSIFNKLLSLFKIVEIDMIKDSFVKIDNGYYSKRNPSNSKFQKFILTDNAGHVFAADDVSRIQKYLYYTLIHKGLDYTGNHLEKKEKLITFLNTYLQQDTKHVHNLPKSFVDLQNILITDSKINEDKLLEHFMPFLDKIFGYLSKEYTEFDTENKGVEDDINTEIEDEIILTEDDVTKTEEENQKTTERSFNKATYNEDPSKLGADLETFISLVYSSNGADIPEFTYLDTRAFIRKLQKTFSTYPINKKQLVKSFYDALSTLSKYDFELHEFKRLLDKTYLDNGVFKKDITLLNKLVGKIVLQQLHFDKGVTHKEKMGKVENLDEFDIYDAFYDSNKDEILSMMNEKSKAYLTSDFGYGKYLKLKKSKKETNLISLNVETYTKDSITKTQYTIGDVTIKKTSKPVTYEGTSYYLLTNSTEAYLVPIGDVELLNGLVMRSNNNYFELNETVATSDTEVFSFETNNDVVKDKSGQSTVALQILRKDFRDLSVDEMKRLEFQKIAMISYLHSLFGVNVTMTYAYMFYKTHYDNLTEKYSELLTLINEPNPQFKIENIIASDAVKYGSDIRANMVKDQNNEPIYALSKNSGVFDMFNESYEERILKNRFIPLNRVSMSMSHREYQGVAFTDLNYAQHLQYSISQFKRGKVNMGQLEGNKTNFFIKLTKSLPTLNKPWFTVNTYLQELKKIDKLNINTIVSNYQIFVDYINTKGRDELAFTEEEIKELSQIHTDSIIPVGGIKSKFFKKSGTFEDGKIKYVPTFQTKGLHKGYRLYFTHGLTVNGVPLKTEVDKNVPSTKQQLIDKIAQLKQLTVDLDLDKNDIDNLQNVKSFINLSVTEIITTLNKNLTKNEATDRKDEIDYGVNTKLFEDYVMSYMIETHNIYSKIYGDKYFEAFDNAQADFTKRQKSLAVFGEPVREHDVKTEEDVVYYLAQRPSIDKDGNNTQTSYDSYFVIEKHEIESYKAQGYEIDEGGIEVTDGQAFNTFIHKYFLQVDKNRQFDLTKPYYSYLMTNKTFIIRNGVSEKVIQNDVIDTDGIKNYRYDDNVIEDIKKAVKYEKSTITSEEVQEAENILNTYGLKSDVAVQQFILDNQNQRISTKEELKTISDSFKNITGLLKSGTVEDNRNAYLELSKLIREKLKIRDELVQTIWSENPTRRLNKERMQLTGTQASRDYGVILQELDYLSNERDRFLGNPQGTTYLYNQLHELKNLQKESIENIEYLHEVKEDEKIIAKYVEYLTKQNFIKTVKSNPLYADYVKYIEQQKYIDTVLKDAKKNQYKNGIYKGATAFTQNGRFFYIKNSEATLERSMYMRPLLGVVDDKGRVITEDRIDAVYKSILNLLDDLEKMQTAEAVNAEKVLLSFGIDTVSLALKENIIKRLKNSFRALYNFHEPIPGQNYIFEKYKELETNNTDVLAYHSGVKVNNINAVIKVPFGGKKNQSEMPNDKGAVTLGTQLEKILLMDSNANTKVVFNGVTTTVGEVKKMYSQSVKFIVDYDVAVIESQLFDTIYKDGKVISKTPNVKNLGLLFQQFVETTRNADYVQEFFETELVNGEYVFKTIPDLSAISNVFFQTLKKIFNEPAKFKVNGEAYQLVSSAAYKTAKINGVNVPLEFRKGNEKIAPLQVLREIYNNESGQWEEKTKSDDLYTAEGYISKNGVEVLKYDVDVVREVHETVIPAYEEWMKEYVKDRRIMTSEELNLKYDPGLFYMLTTRIPTENKRSIAILKIVDFVIPETGSIIISTAAVQAQTGGDHDGDKLFTLRYNAKKINGKWEVIKHQELSDIKKSNVKRLTEKSIFSDIINYSNDTKKSVSKFEDKLQELGVFKTKEVLENEFLELAFSLQSNKYVLESGLQREPTDISVGKMQEKTKQQLDLLLKNQLYSTTGSALKIIFDIIDASKGKKGVGNSANFAQIAGIMEAVGTMTPFNYSFGSELPFKMISTVHNKSLKEKIKKLDEDFVKLYNEWLLKNHADLYNKHLLTAEEVDLRSIRTGIWITVATDFVKNSYAMGINLNDYTQALYLVGASLNIPRNILLHIGTHPLVRHITKNPTKDVKDDILFYKMNLIKDLKNSKYNISQKPNSFTPVKLDLSLSELLRYGKDYDNTIIVGIDVTPKAISKLEDNEVYVHYGSDYASTKGWTTKRQLGIEKGLKGSSLRLNTISSESETNDIREVLITLINNAKAHPDKTFLTTYMSNVKSSIVRTILEDLTRVEKLPDNLKLPLHYEIRQDRIRFEDVPWKQTDDIDTKMAEFKILSLLERFYEFSQTTLELQPLGNINKGDINVNGVFNVLNYLKSPNDTMDLKDIDIYENMVLAYSEEGISEEKEEKLKVLFSVIEDKKEFNDEGYEVDNTEFEIIDTIENQIVETSTGLVPLQISETSLITPSTLSPEDKGRVLLEIQMLNNRIKNSTEDTTDLKKQSGELMMQLLAFNTETNKYVDIEDILDINVANKYLDLYKKSIQKENASEKFLGDSFGNVIEFPNEFLEHIEIPNNFKGKLKIRNKSGFTHFTPYTGVVRLVSLLLPQSAVMSTEGKTILEVFNPGTYKEDIIEMASFIKYGSILRAFSPMSTSIGYSIVDDFKKLEGISVVDNKGVKITLNKFSLSDYNKFAKVIHIILEQNFKNNRFLKALFTGDTSRPFIKNQSMSLDYLKEHLINDIRDILALNDPINNIVKYDSAPYEESVQVVNSKGKLETQITTYVDENILTMTYSDLLKILLKMDLYLNAGKWGNKSLVSFMPVELYKDLTKHTNNWDLFMKSLDSSQRGEVSKTLIMLNSNLLNNVVKKVGVPYIKKATKNLKPLQFEKTGTSKKTGQKKSKILIDSFLGVGDNYTNLSGVIYKGLTAKNIETDKERTVNVINKDSNSELSSLERSQFKSKEVTTITTSNDVDIAIAQIEIDKKKGIYNPGINPETNFPINLGEVDIELINVSDVDGDIGISDEGEPTPLNYNYRSTVIVTPVSIIEISSKKEDDERLLSIDNNLSFRGINMQVFNPVKILIDVTKDYGENTQISKDILNYAKIAAKTQGFVIRTPDVQSTNVQSTFELQLTKEENGFEYYNAQVNKTYQGEIKKLKPNQIFVFGSNTEGRHGKGAAKTAMSFGAKYGQFEGIQGQSFAIITKDLTVPKAQQAKSRSPEQIVEQINKLYSYALVHPEQDFMVAYNVDNNNLNGYSSQEMANMFSQLNIPDNIVFEENFSKLLKPQFSNQESENIYSKTINFQEEPTTGYKQRTINNAKADATIHLGVDFTTAGEKLTKNSVIDQNKKYIPVDAKVLNVEESLIEDIVNQLNSVNAKTLNIAGNGIYSMPQYTQQQIDDFTFNLLNKVLNSPNLTTKIESIRSGGQTGFDEAGAKAGIKLGLPTIVLAPNGWVFRERNSTDKGWEDISDEAKFKERFKVEPLPVQNTLDALNGSVTTQESNAEMTNIKKQENLKIDEKDIIYNDPFVMITIFDKSYTDQNEVYQLGETEDEHLISVDVKTFSTEYIDTFSAVIFRKNFEYSMDIKQINESDNAVVTHPNPTLYHQMKLRLIEAKYGKGALGILTPNAQAIETKVKELNAPNDQVKDSSENCKQ